MSVRRVLIAVALVCGVCVWAIARPGDAPVAAQAPVPAAAPACDAEEDDARDEAAARFRANQSVQWRQVAIGSATSH